MIRRVLFTLSLFTLFLFASCSNLVEGKGSNDFSFSIGKSAADSIAKAVSSSEQIPEDEEFTIECRLLRQESTIKEETKKLHLNQIYKTVFDFSEIPNGSDYFISVKIFYKDIVIYKALSEEIILNNQNDEVEINLQLQQNNSKINYELNGGEFWAGTIKPVEYFINSNTNIPEPVKAHYNFDGWYSTKDFIPETKIKELGKTCFLGDVTLYAKWIKFNQVSAVKITPDNEKFDCGDKITLETSTPETEIYYTLDGTEPTISSNFYDSTKQITITEDLIKDDKITIKAIAVKEGLDNSDVASKTFTRNRYTVTFNTNGHGTLPEGANKTGLKKGEVITLPVLKDVTDYTFNGWSNKEGSSFSGGNYTVTSNITFTANWNKLRELAGVTFKPSATTSDNSLDYNDTVALECATSGAEIYYTTDKSDPVSKGIKYTAPIVITDGVTIKAVAKKVGQSSSKVTEATYTLKQYTVTFNHNGHGTKPEDQIITSSSIATAPSISAVGYTFGGWYEKNDFSGNTWDFSNKAIRQNITLYAKWTVITYNVTYENCGTGSDGIPIDNSMNATTSYNIESSTITLQPPVKSGFRFDGWYGTSDFSGSKVEQIATGSTEDKTLYAKWTDIAPGAVKNLTATTENGAITLSWTNPADKDIDKVVITCDDTSITIKPVSVANKAGQSSNCNVPCTNGKVYNFELKVVDSADSGALESDVQTLSQRLYVLTESPKELTNYSSPNTTPNPPSGGSWTYVEFGDWPQTVKADGVTVGTDVVEKNQWPCYYGSDGYYYVKVTAKPCENYKFLDGKTIVSNTDYYFRLEPIYWRVLTNNYKGNKLLLAENILENCSYFPYTQDYGTRNVSGESQPIQNNNYKYSNVRALLNGYDYVNSDSSTNNVHNRKGFLQKAFTTSAIANNIVDTVVDNSAESTTDAGNNITQATNCFCADTIDKIFLLSEKEITTADYGFDAYDKYIGDGNGTTTSSRLRKPTDYATATGIFIRENYGRWWLRSPRQDDLQHSRDVNYDGEACGHRAHISNIGIVPSLSIKP